MKASEFFNSNSKGSYKAFIENQISDMDVDDLKVVDMGEKDAQMCRVTINKYHAATGKIFKTKLVDGELYVGRVQ